MSRDRKKKDTGATKAGESPDARNQDKREDDDKEIGDSEPVSGGLRRSRPISVIPEVADVEQAAERRGRFFTRPASGDSSVQSISGLRRRWRWFRPGKEMRPPSDLTDTEARAEAAKTAAAALRSRLRPGERPRRTSVPSPPPGGGAGSVPESASVPPAASRLPASSASVAESVVDADSAAAPPSSGPVPGSQPRWARGSETRATSSAGPDAGIPSPAGPESRAGETPASSAGSASDPGRRRAASTHPGHAPTARPAARESALRRWRRPLTELSRPQAWQRHDILVVAVALVLFATGVILQRRLAAPSLLPMNQLGLHLSRPLGWLPPRRVGPPTAGLAAPAEADGDDDAAGGLPYHMVIQSALDPAVRLEIRIAERPSTGNLRSALVLQRVGRHGEAHWAADSTDRTIGGRDWVRTEYRYADKGSKTDAPRIATGVEYATINGRLLYTVTLHGSDETARRLESLLVPTLSVDANHPAAVGAR